MKKLFVAAMALLCCGMMQAKGLKYEPKAGLTNRVYVGMNIANLRNADMDPKVGQSIGYIGEYMLPGCAGTFVNFGVDYSMAGAKYKFYDMDDKSYTNKLRTHYVSIPLHVGYRYNVLKNLGVYADFGPSFGLGLGGKWSEDDVKFFKDGEKGMDAKRFDCALGFRLGTEYNDRLSLTFGFDWGLNKTMEIIEDKEVKTFRSNITLGYRF